MRQTIVLDKTGTLTQGKPTVTDFVSVSGTDTSQELTLLQFAASVERNSEHPLAEAVVQYAQSQEVTVTTIEFTPEEPGQYPFTCGMNMFRGVVEVQASAPLKPSPALEFQG
jgi:cation transport ATPase